MIQLTFEYGVGNLATDASGLLDDQTFLTAIFISLLTNARALPEETLETTNLGGFWGDTYADVEGDEIGSKLWLLEGLKATDDTLAKAEQYANAALAWMKADGITDEITAAARRVGEDVLDLEIQIDRPDLPADQWLGTWEATIAGVE